MPGDEGKTRGQLLEALEATRKRIAELEPTRGNDQVVVGSSTDRKRAEAVLHESEVKFRAIFEEAGDPIWLVDTQDGSLVEFNDAAHQSLGYTREEFEGLKLSDIHAVETPEETRAQTERVIREGCAQFESKHRTRTGGIRDVTLKVRHLMLGDKSYALAVIRDVTERKQTEAALRAEVEVRTRAERRLRNEQERLEAILDTVGDPIFVKDNDHRIILANRAFYEIFGVNEDIVIGKTLAEEVPPAERQHFLEIDRRVLDTGRPDMREESLTAANRATRTIVTRKTRFIEDSGDKFLVGSIHDITDLKRGEEEKVKLEAQLQEAQRLESLGVLAGGIAHDFNNLLTTIQGNAELVIHSLPAHAVALERVQKILQATRMAATLISQMLAYSGKGQFVVQALDLNALVRDMTSLLSSSRSKKAELQLHLSPDPATIRADVAQLRQIVMNLVINASESLGDAPGLIRIETRVAECGRACLDAFSGGHSLPEGHYVILEVSDTGHGMDEETSGKIFDPFFTTKFTGRGLGLSAVQGIVRSHRGAIKVESELGRGTTLSLLFPAWDDEARPTEAPVGVEEDWRGSGTILLVEDEELVRELAVLILEGLGFSVLETTDGIEAVDLFRQRHDEIACVLLDYKMPRMDGVEAFEELRRIRDDVPILLTSGYAEQEAFAELSKNGLAGFVSKPYGPATLRTKLREVLGE